MSAFVVLLHDDETAEADNDLIREQLRSNYEEADLFEFSDSVFFVTGPRLVDDVATGLGLMDDEQPRRGVVVSLNGSHSGRSWKRLWDWLRAADAERAL